MKTEIIRRKRILVVEDEAVFRDWIKQGLEKRGYAVTPSNNGAEAMSLFSNHDFDVILTDYGLPFMTGDELAKRIKTLAPRQPVVIVTGHSNFRCPDKSVDAVLIKPFEADELGRVIERLLLKSEQTVCN
jgi:CheY-like chemotaxis protein